MAAAVCSVVVDRLGVDTPVIVRSSSRIAGLLAWGPFPEQDAARPQHVYALVLVE